MLLNAIQVLIILVEIRNGQILTGREDAICLYRIDSIASQYLFSFLLSLTNTESETNPNDNLMMRRAGLPVPEHRLQKPDRQHEESLENLESQESKRGKQKQTSKVYLGRFGPKLFHEQACGSL